MGQPLDDYNELFPLFTQVTEEQFINPLGSAQQLIAFADRVATLCISNNDKIISEGLLPEYLDTIRKRINAYAVAEMKPRQAIAAGNDNWKDRKDEALELRGDLFLYGEAAFEGYMDLMEKLHEIMAGRGNSDMIQDLLDLVGLYREYIHLFEAFKKFDHSWLDRAEQLFTELRMIRSMIDNPEDTIAELEYQEKQAYTYMEFALREMIKFGRLAFRKDSESLQILVRDYTGRSL